MTCFKSLSSSRLEDMEFVLAPLAEDVGLKVANFHLKSPSGESHDLRPMSPN